MADSEAREEPKGGRKGAEGVRHRAGAQAKNVPLLFPKLRGPHASGHPLSPPPPPPRVASACVAQHAGGAWSLPSAPLCRGLFLPL